MGVPPIGHYDMNQTKPSYHAPPSLELDSIKDKAGPTWTNINTECFND